MNAKIMIFMTYQANLILITENKLIRIQNHIKSAQNYDN